MTLRGALRVGWLPGIDFVEVLDPHRRHVNAVGLHSCLPLSAPPRRLSLLTRTERLLDHDQVRIVLSPPKPERAHAGGHLNRVVVARPPAFVVRNSAAAEH